MRLVSPPYLTPHQDHLDHPPMDPRPQNGPSPTASLKALKATAAAVTFDSHLRSHQRLLAPRDPLR